jgi:hypothetical protein
MKTLKIAGKGVLAVYVAYVAIISTLSIKELWPRRNDVEFEEIHATTIKHTQNLMSFFGYHPFPR